MSSSLIALTDADRAMYISFVGLYVIVVLIWMYVYGVLVQRHTELEEQIDKIILLYDLRSDRFSSQISLCYDLIKLNAQHLKELHDRIDAQNEVKSEPPDGHGEENTLVPKKYPVRNRMRVGMDEENPSRRNEVLTCGVRGGLRSSACLS